jgi:UDPglucose 6-dehydrogenase
MLGSVIEHIEDAGVIVLLTDWAEFLQLDPKRVAMSTSCRVIFDVRNCLDENKWLQAGFKYCGLGR